MQKAAIPQHYKNRDIVERDRKYQNTYFAKYNQANIEV